MAGRNGRSSFLLLVLSVLLLAVAGYTGYILYPRFDLPPATGVSLLALAAAAGIASLFSPCSFPLLMTLLAREAVEHGRLIRTAIAFTAGMTLFLLLAGLTLALGAGRWISAVTFTSSAGRLLRLTVGLALISFGLWPVQGKSWMFPWLNQVLQPLWTKQAQLRRRQSSLSYGLYGFGYILAGFG
jgi:cytochrome c biogenesis protein CcdA